MLLTLTDLIAKHGLRIHGILHVGAHQCEEADKYAQHGIKDVIWVDANPALCGPVAGGRFVHHAVVSDVDGVSVDFIVTNNGASSSILELHDHRIMHPDIVEVQRLPQTTTTLNTLLRGIQDAPFFNLVNLDIKGAELLALRGLSDHLPHVDYIYIEVNIRELYKGNVLLPDLDAFLGDQGFDRTDISMTSWGWGDALYVRTRPPPAA